MDIEQVKKEIRLGIIQKIDKLDMKSSIITREPLVFNYQGFEYHVEFETIADGFFIRTYTKDKEFLLLGMVMETNANFMQKHEVRVFMPDNFVRPESIGADDTSSYNYSIELFMSEYITRLMQKNLRYDVEFYV